MTQDKDYGKELNFGVDMKDLYDLKILSWLLKGPIEYNNASRLLDINLLIDCFLPQYKPLVRIIRDYFNRYKAPPHFQILEDNLINDIELIEVLEAIKEVSCEENEIGFYIDQAKRRYQSYLAKTLSQSIEEEGEVDVDEFTTNIIKIGSKIDRLNRSSTFAEGNFTESVKSRFDTYKYTEDNPGTVAGVFTGYRELDEYLWGIKKQEMMIISGPSSSGKSMLMLNMAINAWLGTNDPLLGAPTRNDGADILYFTLEMSKEQTEQRIDACIAGLEHNHLTRGLLTPEEKLKWNKSLRFQSKYDKKLYICDMSRGSKMIDIESRFETIIAEFKPELVCIDYIGIMKPNNSLGSDWLDIGYIAEEMAEFCRRKDIPVITAAQRKIKNKSAKVQETTLEDMARSKMLGDNANIVLLIDGREEEHLREDMVLHIAKNRDGAKGKVTLIKDFAKSRVLSVPDDWAEDIGDENEI